MTTKKNKGLGDLVETATKAIGIKPCVKCQNRKDKLNALFPFQKAKPMKKEQKEWFKKFIEEKHKTLNREQANQISEIYTYCFDIKFDVSGCTSCSGSLFNTMIYKLTKVMNNS